MSVEFNKKLLFDNISYLLKSRGKRIGELETEAGVSPGYISRTSKDGSAKPGIDFILKAADALNVSVDTLLRKDLASITPTERYLISFLQKLIGDTLDDKLKWGQESANYLNNRLESDVYGHCDHPLFEVETFSEEGENGYPDEVTRIVFISRSFDVHTCIAGDCFNLRMKNGAYLYLMDICKSVFRSGDSEVFAKEVWMCSQKGENHFLCSTNDAPEISSLIDGLYSAVAESARHPKVDKDIKEIIDAFMIDDWVDEEELPFS